MLPANDEPAYGGSTIYLCSVAGAAHIPVNWQPDA